MEQNINWMEELQQLVISPQSTLENKNIRWDKLARKWKTDLPEDYKEFIEVFGTGDLTDSSDETGLFLFIWSPVTKSISHYNLFQNWFEEDREVWQEEIEFDIRRGYDTYNRIYPTKGGLLSFGSDTQGNTLFWKTQGEPRNWTVMIRNLRGEPTFESFDMGMVEFLVKLLRHDIVSQKLGTCNPPYRFDNSRVLF